MELTDIETLIKRVYYFSPKFERLQQRKLLTVLKGLWLLQQLPKATVLPLGQLELQHVVALLEGLSPLEQQKLLTMLEGLSLLEQRKLLTVLEGLSPLERQTLLTVLKGRKAWEQWKLLELLVNLGKRKQKKLLGLLEEMEPVKLLKLLERVGPQERENFYQLLVLMEPMELKMLLELELQRLESLGSEVEKLERLKLQGPLEAYKRLLQLLLEWLSVYLSEDGDRRGGFRNLLLDGWWLEFWEIILLAAGDVERNPGPRRMTDEQLKNIDGTILEPGNLREVFDAVHNCRAKWCNLCLILGISDDDLSAIKREQSDDSDDCLREGLTRWLKEDYDTEKHGQPTWRNLVDAVANSAGGADHALALNIAEEHKTIKALSPQTSCHCGNLKRAKEMSSAFSRMYRSIVRLLQVKVNEVKDSLRYLTDPQCPDKLCVPSKVYEDATSTKDLLRRLCPRYINPKDTFVLEEIVSNFGSQRCKGLLKDYTDELLSCDM